MPTPRDLPVPDRRKPVAPKFDKPQDLFGIMESESVCSLREAFSVMLRKRASREFYSPGSHTMARLPYLINLGTWAFVLGIWSTDRLLAQPIPNEPPSFKKMMEQFGSQSKSFLPGFFGELSEEQLQRIEKVPISPREEKLFGARVLRDYESTLQSNQLSLQRQGQEIDYLRTLVNRIRPLLKNHQRYKEIDVALVNTNRIDAYSIPGGHLIFTSGILEDCRSEAALVGVIAHELSHLDRGHQLLVLKQQKSLGQSENLQSTMLWVSMFAKPLRPEFETQADQDAARWMLEAGYDARELVHLLERWDLRLSQQQPWADAVPDFLRSHPPSDRRAQNVLKEYDQWRGNKSKLRIGVENLANRTAIQP